ncbi:MAG: hypothetical protein PVH89_04885 [Gammaproteobacteria bacterium]|jgi:hypothetical protein
MSLARARTFSLLYLMTLSPLTATAQPQFSRLVLSGPDLAEPIELSTHVLTDIDLESPGFVHLNRWLQNRDPIHGYRIEFFADQPGAEDDPTHVADFEWHYGEDRGFFIHFPAPPFATDDSNGRTFDSPIFGRWLYVTEEWGRAVYAAIRQANDPGGNAEASCPVTAPLEPAFSPRAGYATYESPTTGLLFGDNEL